jgi:hypothetical protein
LTRPLDNLSLYLSFGKYLELFFYDESFRKVHRFQYGKYAIEIRCEPIYLFEMRVSKHQFVKLQNENHVVDDNTHSKSYLEVLRPEIKQEIVDFYQNLRNYLDTETLKATDEDSKRKDVLEDLIQTSYIEESNLIDELQNINIQNINNIRRQATEIIQKRKVSIESLMEPPPIWYIPDYAL